MTGRADPRGQRMGTASANACSSGKQAHSSRASAKAHARGLRDLGEHVRPYLCDECLLWHVGHLPQRVMTGDVDADTYYGRNRQDTA